MRSIIRTVCVIALLPLVAACTFGLDLPKLQTMTPTGSPFTQELASGYRGISQEQAREYDWTSAEVFAKKALQAANGEAVLPELPIDWYNRMPDSSIQSAYLELMDVRAKLVAKLDGGARDNDAVRAARAQVAYDCWVEEASEPNSAAEAAACRQTVLAFLATTAAVATSVQSAAPLPEVYLVFFAFDKSDISPVAARVLDRVIDDFHKTGSARLDVQGYTDLSGSVAYNLKLSERRADAVKRYLVEHGVKPGEVRTEWFGKSHPRVPTPDGVRNQENRRAELYLKK
jgi:OOP family OmpA-OmpF porin